MAGVYTVFILLMSWILPLFPAEPKLGPLYHQVTHFVTPEFPLLLLVPAFVLNLVWQRTAEWGNLRRAVISGVVSVVVLAAVQWPFADFLMSPAARNWFFGTKYFGYYVSPNGLMADYRFVETAFWREAALALATASPRP